MFANSSESSSNTTATLQEAHSSESLLPCAQWRASLEQTAGPGSAGTLPSHAWQGCTAATPHRWSTSARTPPRQSPAAARPAALESGSLGSPCSWPGLGAGSGQESGDWSRTFSKRQNSEKKSKQNRSNIRSLTKLGSYALQAEVMNTEPYLYSFSGEVVLLDNYYSLVPGRQYHELITNMGGKTVMKRTPHVTMFLKSKNGCQKRPVRKCKVISESDFWTLIGSKAHVLTQMAASMHERSAKMNQDKQNIIDSIDMDATTLLWEDDFGTDWPNTSNNEV